MTAKNDEAAIVAVPARTEPAQGSRPRAHPMSGPESRLRRLLDRAGSPAQDRYAPLRIQDLPESGSAIAYFELGDPQGVPLLCLHGLSVSGLYFDEYHPELAERGIRGIAPCMLGGIYLHETTRTMSVLTGALIELMDALNVSRFDTLGFSWGTLAQLALIVRAPGRIRRAGLVGPMLPTRFMASGDIERLKPDVRASLAMARHVPALHRSLMGLVGLLPVSALLRQFIDEQASEQERAALEQGGSLRAGLALWIDECRRTGSSFYTRAWQLMQEEPDYALGDLAAAGSQVDLRLYAGENDSVHLPIFADMIAAAHCGVDVGELQHDEASTTPIMSALAGANVYRAVFSHGRTRILLAPGAGRMACMLYLRQAMDDLLSSGQLP
jgi:pimeloyl-ACP methyl ester carboxylesterase